ncbi:hypothetical protein [Pseudomonas sp. NPDC007930]|uniref:hypothetical protein n=1 Tax=Pseudomonas sp. NPDC007930 TaxID=3364417 RepID=UPI0036E28D94
MNLELQLLCDAPDAVALIHRYWATGEDGQFLEKVAALLPFRNFTSPAQVTQYVREQCRVLDLNQRCPRCAEAVLITTRSAARAQPQRSPRHCQACEEKIESAKREARAQAEQRLAERLCAYMQARPPVPADYATVTDDTAVLLLALNTAIAPRLAAGGFSGHDCKALAPAHVGHFIERLHQAGVLMEAPAHAAPGTYYLDGDALRVKVNQRAFELQPGLAPGHIDTLLAAYHRRSFNDAPRLYDLWLDYAEADCMAYFNTQCAIYQHELYADELAEVRSALRAGLEHYSVAQLWSAIWRVVRDAASLANRTYYNRAKASATLPGKLRRLLERARREALELKSWRRPEPQPAGALGMVLAELFGIDENTPGSVAWATFAHRSEDWAGVGEPKAWMASRRLMVRALEADMPFATLKQFAEILAAGYPLDAAIHEVLSRWPAPGAAPGWEAFSGGPGSAPVEGPAP